MPRYVFTVQDASPLPDSVEIDLAGPEVARSLAMAEASETLRDLQNRAWPSPDWWVSVTDEEGGTVCSLRIEGMS